VRRIFLYLLATIFLIFAQLMPSATGAAAFSSERLRNSQLSLHVATRGPIHPSAWKGYSANFAVTEFYEVGA
jgi:hypothetical protein